MMYFIISTLILVGVNLILSKSHVFLTEASHICG
jgi:hypothetical protein